MDDIIHTLKSLIDRLKIEKGDHFDPFMISVTSYRE